MKILDTVTGSNQRFIQFQTVGKKEGAPMILNPLLVLNQTGGFGKGEDVRKYDPESRDSEQ